MQIKSFLIAGLAAVLLFTANLFPSEVNGMEQEGQKRVIKIYKKNFLVSFYCG